MPKLCLGTAQFGLAYGVTNSAGKVSEKLVSEILSKASSVGISFLDTAPAYGNAEEVIGRQLPACHSLRLMSKLSKSLNQVFTCGDQHGWELAFKTSCQRLRTENLDAFILHSAKDLHKPGSEYLEEWLLSLRERGLAQRLGVSIYSSTDLEDVNLEMLDIVQLPLSLYDQRLLNDGTVSYLNSQGIAVHARSIYLQGLLLTPSAEWPAWTDCGLRAHHKALEILACNRGCRLIDLALGFAHDQPDVEAVVLGVCSIQELEELSETWSSTSPWNGSEWKNWSLQDVNSIDPRNWPSLGAAKAR